MKILHVATYDFAGGAARAAYRIHCSLYNNGVDSEMRVLNRDTDNDRVKGNSSLSITSHLIQTLQKRWRRFARRTWSTTNPILHTFGEISAGVVNELNESDADILNLHWVSNLLSIKDIGRLNKPIVWTMHDMWPFCGGEHYEPDNISARFRQGYRMDNRPIGEHGPDLNRKTWEAKQRAWKRQHFTLVSPSKWLANCAHESFLFAQFPAHVIPNPLETHHLWRPISRDVVRIGLGLPQQKKLVLMGADGGITDPRKGGDLLRDIVSRITASQTGNVELLIFGQEKSSNKDTWPCPVHWLGAIQDDRLLAQIYSAADIMVVPSRQDNLPNTALEAQACGTPVAAFNIGGLADIVIHRETGWLAKPFDTKDLAEGILWILENEKRHAALLASARKHAVARYSQPVVAEKYIELYNNILNKGEDMPCRKLNHKGGLVFI